MYIYNIKIVMKGKFIAIEGVDGTGKGTQHNLLLKRMQFEGIPVVTVDFPQYDSSLFGKLIGQALKGDFGEYKNIPPEIMSVVYAADRFKASPFIRENLEKGVNVLANRYTLSNSHQAVRVEQNKRENFVSWLFNMEYGIDGFCIPRPNLYIHLDVPFEISQELILQKNHRGYLSGEAKDALEKDLENQIQTAEMYRYLASILPEVVSINCAPEGKLLRINDIHELVWKESRNLFREDGEGVVRGEREL